MWKQPGSEYDWALLAAYKEINDQERSTEESYRGRKSVTRGVARAWLGKKLKPKLSESQEIIKLEGGNEYQEGKGDEEAAGHKNSERGE